MKSLNGWFLLAVSQGLSFNFFLRISIAMQCGNAATFLGARPDDNDAGEYFDEIF